MNYHIRILQRPRLQHTLQAAVVFTKLLDKERGRWLPRQRPVLNILELASLRPVVTTAMSASIFHNVFYILKQTYTTCSFALCVTLLSTDNVVFCLIAVIIIHSLAVTSTQHHQKLFSIKNSKQHVFKTKLYFIKNVMILVRFG